LLASPKQGSSKEKRFQALSGNNAGAATAFRSGRGGAPGADLDEAREGQRIVFGVANESPEAIKLGVSGGNY
jgi:hypothetical protein